MPLNGIVVGAFSIALIHRPRVPQLFAATLLALSAGGCSGQAALLSPTSPGVDASAQEVVASRPPSTLAASASEHRGCPALGNPGGNSGMRFIGLMAVEEAVALSVVRRIWFCQRGLHRGAPRRRRNARQERRRTAVRRAGLGCGSQSPLPLGRGLCRSPLAARHRAVGIRG